MMGGTGPKNKQKENVITGLRPFLYVLCVCVWEVDLPCCTVISSPSKHRIKAPVKCDTTEACTFRLISQALSLQHKLKCNQFGPRARGSAPCRSSSDIIPADIKHFVIYVSKSCQHKKNAAVEQANEIVKCNRNQVSEQTEQLTNCHMDRLTRIAGKAKENFV